MNIDLTGKKAIVTGGTRGIGRSMVTLFIESGCEVIYTGTSDNPKNKIEGAKYEQLNLLSVEKTQFFINNLFHKEEKIDILVNNAGINIIEPIDELHESNWQKIMAVNLTGPMNLIKEAAKNMKEKKTKGKILNISSIFGCISKSSRNAYSTSKAGLIGLTRSASLDLAPYNILVNALCPGFTRTELTKSILSKQDITDLTSQIPIKRFARSEEIAKVALFLCSDLNTYLTGQTIIVDGGFTIQ